VPGVRHVAERERHENWIGFEVEAERDHDVRRAVAQTVVGKGWGLLELRPKRVSLEEIFLQLTTEEPANQAVDAPAEPTREEAARE
jgi:ABC-2 type transport system ATP-binding protein